MTIRQHQFAWVATLTLLAIALAVPAGAEIQDGAHGGNPHFYFLPPMVPNPTFSGAFDASLSPEVRICEWAESGCASEIVVFTTAGEGSRRLRVEAADELYIVNWKTRDFSLDPAKIYRLSVLANGATLGHADVIVSNTAVEGFVSVAARSTLPVKFRIEDNALIADAEPLVEHARALLTADDPVAGYQALLNEIAQLYVDVGPLEAQRQLDIAGTVAFVGVPWESLKQLHLALDGHVFTSGAITGTGALATRLKASAASESESTFAEERGTTLIFVNGIWNDSLTAADGTLNVWNIAKENEGWLLSNGYTLEQFYNASWAESVDAATTCPLGALLGTDPFGLCTALADLEEAAAQLLNIMQGFPESGQPTAQALADKIQLELDNGRNVIVVAHSQGNLMTLEALQDVARLRRCVGVVSLASPTSEGFPSDILLNGFSLGGEEVKDIILSIPLAVNDFAVVPSAATTFWDELVQGSVPPFSTWAKLKGAAELHHLPTYTDQVASRNLIRDYLKSQDSVLRSRCQNQVVIEPSAAMVTLGDPQEVLNGIVKDPDDRDVIPYPPIQWESLQPEIAGAESIGGASPPAAVVTGIEKGTAQIKASSPGAKPGFATVTVDCAATVSLTIDGPPFVGGGNYYPIPVTRWVTAVVVDELGNPTQLPVTWTTSDESTIGIATVGNQVLVYGATSLKEGTSTITAALDGCTAAQASIDITADYTGPAVSATISPNEIYISKPSGAGASATLNWVVTLSGFDPAGVVALALSSFGTCGRQFDNLPVLVPEFSCTTEDFTITLPTLYEWGTYPVETTLMSQDGVQNVRFSVGPTFTFVVGP